MRAFLFAIMMILPISAWGNSMQESYDFSKVKQYVNEQIDARDFPGASLLVQHRGKVIYHKSWGTYCSRTNRHVPLKNNVTHMMYSVSKVISATVIVIAHQKGLIDYDAPVYTYIPEYCGAGKDNCTIRHLLTHSAGIPNCPMGPVDTIERWNDTVKGCCEYPVEWEPGSRTAYHATQGLFLAAEAVRRAAGMDTWEEVCRKFLFDEIGADSLTFTIPSVRTVSLTLQPKEVPLELNAAFFGAAGHPGAGCFGKMEDVLKILDINMHGGKYNGKQIIDPSELREMHRVQYEKQISAAEAAGERPMHEPWGLGWLIKRNQPNSWFGLCEAADPAAFSHAGIDTVIAVADPKRDLAFVFLTTNSPKDANVTRKTVAEMVTDIIDASGK